MSESGSNSAGNARNPWIIAFLSAMQSRVAGMTILCYLLGFGVTALYLSQFGIVNVEVLRTRYILTGAAFLLFIVLLFDGLSLGFQLGCRGVPETARSSTITWDVAKRLFLLVVFPYLIVIPSALAIERSELRYWRPKSPAETFLYPFILAWLCPFVFFSVIGIVVSTIPFLRRRFLMSRDTKAAIKFTDLTLGSPTKTMAKAISDGPLKTIAVIAVGVAALVLYSESIYDQVPQQIGGGLPVNVLAVSSSSGNMKDKENTQRSSRLIARTTNSLIFEVHTASTAGTPTATDVRIVEVAPSKIDDIDYDTARTSLYSELYQWNSASFTFRLLKFAESESTPPAITANDLLIGDFCVTLNPKPQNKSDKICDQDGVDQDTRPGIITVDGLDEKDYSVSPTFTSNGTTSTCGGFQNPEPKTIHPYRDALFDTDLVFKPMCASFGFIMTQRQPDSTVQTVLPLEMLVRGSFCMTLQKRDGSAAEFKVCDQGAADSDSRYGYIRIDNLETVEYIATASPPPSQTCASWVAPPPTTIRPSVDVYYEAGMIFGQNDCNQEVKP